MFAITQSSLPRFILAVLFVSCLTGCVSTTISSSSQCEEGFGLQPRELIGESLSQREELEQKISSSGSSVEFSYAPPLTSSTLPEDFDVRWREGGLNFHIAVRQGIAVQVGASDADTYAGRTLSDVVDCFGPPEEYIAWLGNSFQHPENLIEVHLLYPTKGIVAFARSPISSDLGAQGREFDSDSISMLSLSTILYSQPMSGKDLVSLAYWFDERSVPASISEWYFSKIAPWPGAFAEIDILRGEAAYP